MVVKMKDICTKIGSGATPKGGKDSYIDEGISLIRSQNILDFSFSHDGLTHITEEQASKLNGVTIEKDDVLLNITGDSVARACMVDNSVLPARVNQHVLIVRGNQEKIINSYILYFIQMKKLELLQMASGGATRNALTKGMIEELEIELPSLEEQQRIVSVLNLIQNKIETNKKINRNLSEQVATIYKSWFVDFDRNGGLCPEEWKEATLGDVADIVSGKRPPMKQTDKTDKVIIPLVGAASIMGYTNAVLYDSKILVTGRVGTHGVIQRFDEECWPSDNTLVITTQRYEFVNQILLNVDYKSLNRGSTQPLITQGDLKKIDIILPTSDILDEFETLAEGLMAQYEKNRVENIKLAEVRDSLLPKLMSGELDVSGLNI